MSYPAIVLFGDSLTERSFDAHNHGSGAALAKAYARRADVLNRGVGGYNTRWLLPFLTQILENPPQKPLLFVLLIGTNDSILPTGPNNVPLSEYRQNLKTMVNLIRSTPSTSSSKILLITPPPIHKALLEKSGGKNRDYEITREYANAMFDVAREAKEGGIAGVDYFRAFEAAVEREREKRGGQEEETWMVEWLPDGVHLGPKGYELLFQMIMDAIGENWEEILPKSLPLMVQWWGDRDEVKEFNRQQLQASKR